jgi:hypothetical protein
MNLTSRQHSETAEDVPIRRLERLRPCPRSTTKTKISGRSWGDGNPPQPVGTGLNQWPLPRLTSRVDKIAGQSDVDLYFDTVGVTGSIPVSSTSYICRSGSRLAIIVDRPFWRLGAKWEQTIMEDARPRYVAWEQQLSRGHHRHAPTAAASRPTARRSWAASHANTCRTPGIR